MATRTKRRLSDAERAERRSRDRETFEAAVRELYTSDGWLRWARTRAVFRRYSVGNQILIAMQRPDATRVAGFRAWLKLNRCVRKGERGIRIWAPCTVKARDPESGEQLHDEHDAERTTTFFKLTAVFDVAQTEPLPNTEPVPLEPPGFALVGDTHADLIAPLTTLGEQLGYNVELRELPAGGPGGWCDRRPSVREIVVATGAANRVVRTLIHELAHALVGDLDLAFGYAHEEVIVETVTFIVGQAVGLDTSSESVPYVAGWGEDGALEAVQKLAGLIDDIARRIEDAVAVPAAGPIAAAA